MKNAFLFLLVLFVAGGAAYYVSRNNNSSSSTRLRVTSITRGDLLSTINATGTLQAEEIVNVGAQVAGRIVGFGEDSNSPSGLVDFCSVVEQDTVLARIDPTNYEAALEQAEATLQSSEAQLEQLKAQYQRAENEWKRAQRLMPTRAISESEYDTAQADYEVAAAQVKVGEATIRQNKASVKTAQINLGYCTIQSPVRGTIIDRRVNIGQTVVASLNAPSLFLIAKDLTRMQVWTSVNEADIGRIRLGMNVRFTVDAHENEAFEGVVSQIRMNAQMTQNVVTYTVVVTTDNADGLLLPYLTANVNFEIERKPDVLLIPNAALRWSPDETQLDPSVDKTVIDAELSEGKGRVWLAGSNGLVKPLEVLIGSTDGIVTEVDGPGTEVGVFVVTGEEEKDISSGEVSDDTETSNPFLPKMPKGRRPPPGPM